MKKDVPNPMTVQGIDSQGNAPDRRISTVSAAMDAYNSMVYAYRQGGRDQRHACIYGIYAGFPPIPVDEMQKMGLGDMPNVNTREFEAAINAYVDVWNAVNCQSDQWWDVEAEHDDPMEAQRRSKVITKAFNWACGVWIDPSKKGFFNKTGRYILETAARDTQMGLFGVGIGMWRDPIDFRFTTIATRNFKVPDDTKISFENCPCVCIEDDMSVSQLWQMREKKGWDKEQIQRLLYLNQSAQGFLDTNRSTYAQWVEWARENESFMITDFLPVPFVHIYTQEFDGRISHLCFSPTQPGKVQNPKAAGYPEKDGFLYDAPESEWVDSWNQAVAIFADNVGPEGRYHGVKGFGDRNYDMCNFSNLIFNRAAMSAIVVNTPIFSSEDEGAKQRLEQSTITPWAIIQPGMNFQQVPLKADIGGMVSVYDLGTRTRNLNNRKFPIGDKGRNGEAPTATQVNSDTAKEAEFTNLQISNYRATGLDPLGSEMYRRIAQKGADYPESWGGGRIAKRFREMCEKEGIPEGELLNVKCVRANRNGGSGSLAIDVMKHEKLMGVATPGEGQYAARLGLASALVGADMAPIYVQPPQDLPKPVNREIVDENNFISDGKVPLALPSDPHEVHIPAHSELGAQLSQIAGQFEQTGVTPDNLDDAVLLSAKINACIQHLAQHIKFMRELPPRKGAKSLYEEQIKAADSVVNSLTQLLSGLDQDIEKAAMESQQAKAQQMSPEMVKVEAEIAMMEKKTNAEIAMRQAQTEQKMGDSAMKSEQKTMQKIADAEMTAGIKAQQTVAEMEHTRAKGQEEMAIRAAEAEQQLAIEGEKGRQEILKKGIDTVLDVSAAQEKAKAGKEKPSKSK